MLNFRAQMRYCLYWPGQVSTIIYIKNKHLLLDFESSWFALQIVVDPPTSMGRRQPRKRVYFFRNTELVSWFSRQFYNKSYLETYSNHSMFPVDSCVPIGLKTTPRIARNTPKRDMAHALSLHWKKSISSWRMARYVNNISFQLSLWYKYFGSLYVRS